MTKCALPTLSQWGALCTAVHDPKTFLQKIIKSYILHTCSLQGPHHPVLDWLVPILSLPGHYQVFNWSMSSHCLILIMSVLPLVRVTNCSCVVLTITVWSHHSPDVTPYLFFVLSIGGPYLVRVTNCSCVVLTITVWSHHSPYICYSVFAPYLVPHGLSLTCSVPARPLLSHILGSAWYLAQPGCW